MRTCGFEAKMNVQWELEQKASVALETERADAQYRADRQREQDRAHLAWLLTPEGQAHTQSLEEIRRRREEEKEEIRGREEEIRSSQRERLRREAHNQHTSNLARARDETQECLRCKSVIDCDAENHAGHWYSTLVRQGIDRSIVKEKTGADVWEEVVEIKLRQAVVAQGFCAMCITPTETQLEALSASIDAENRHQLQLREEASNQKSKLFTFANALLESADKLLKEDFRDRDCMEGRVVFSYILCVLLFYSLTWPYVWATI